jgi:hypothetical protein
VLEPTDVLDEVPGVAVAGEYQVPVTSSRLQSDPRDLSTLQLDRRQGSPTSLA